MVKGPNGAAHTQSFQLKLLLYNDPSISFTFTHRLIPSGSQGLLETAPVAIHPGQDTHHSLAPRSTFMHPLKATCMSAESARAWRTSSLASPSRSRGARYLLIYQIWGGVNPPAPWGFNHKRPSGGGGRALNCWAGGCEPAFSAEWRCGKHSLVKWVCRAAGHRGDAGGDSKGRDTRCPFHGLDHLALYSTRHRSEKQHLSTGLVDLWLPADGQEVAERDRSY